MKKRQRKKNNKSLITVNDISGEINIYLKKKYWNKGLDTYGTMTVTSTGDFISLDYIKSKRFRYFAKFENCHELTVSFHKNFCNKNRIEKC